MGLELIQIIEEGHERAQALDKILRKASFRTNVAFDGATGIQDIWRLRPALVLLDHVLPGISGRDVCVRLRTDPQTRAMGIIFVTALASEDHRVAALDLGADDVISEPYSSRELVARVKAVLRRVSIPPPTSDEELGEDLTVEETQYVISFRGTRVVLNQFEWTILLRLAKTAGKVVPREELRSALWGEDDLSRDRELERTIQSLNRKLARDADPSETISGIAGTGYRLIRKPRVLPLGA